MSKSCCIIGAGLAGLTAAHVLEDHGWRVTILDKGRQAGGRMSTRAFGAAVFDYGAQFFTVRDKRFMKVVQSWMEAGIAKEWFTVEGHPRYIGSSGMNGIPAYLARGLRDLRVSEHVERVTAGWEIATRTGHIHADCVIATAPAEQSLQMFEGQLERDVISKLSQIHFEPCFAVMAIVNSPTRVPEPGYIRPQTGPISWLADNQQKGISKVPAVTIHARPEFTRMYWDEARDHVGRMLLEAGAPWMPGDIVERQVHRWKYSLLATTLAEPCLKGNEEGSLYFAGDAFGGPRVEGAYLSGLAAAEALLSR